MSAWTDRLNKQTNKQTNRDIGDIAHQHFHKGVSTYCPRDVCMSNVTNVDVAGHKQLLASKAYLNSSSQTT